VLKIGPKVRIQLVVEENPESRVVIEDAASLWELLKDEVRKWDRERFFVLLLDRRNSVIGFDEVAVGFPALTVVSRHNILKAVILSNAAAFVCVHNHPEGNPEPSEDDKVVTQQILELGIILGTPMMDHVILGAESYYSFVEAGFKNKQEVGH